MKKKVPIEYLFLCMKNFEMFKTFLKLKICLINKFKLNEIEMKLWNYNLTKILLIGGRKILGKIFIWKKKNNQGL